MSALLLFSFLAGLLDAIVGGGGLIQLPALLVVRHADPIGTLLGTNKVAALAGVLVASWTYLKRVHVDRSRLACAALLAAGGSVAGAWAVSLISPRSFRSVALVLIVVVGIIVMWRSDLGVVPTRKTDRVRTWLLLCTAIGIYDGFFGPGTGTFLIFASVWLMGMEFVGASVHAKVINAATNLAAVAVFAWRGEILWQLAFPMAACNMLGSFFGARIALARGSGFVRVVFLVVVGALALRLAIDLFSGA
ncbi:MAG: TSUP family transporter [Acidobacteriota bacterium]